DLGYRGRNQYWFGLMGPNIADCGLEGRGMHSQPIIYNFTLIGSGQGATAKNPVAVRLTDGSGGHFGMGILADFPHQGVEVEDLIGEADSYTKLTSGSLRFISNIWSDFGAGNSFSANVLIQVANDAEDPTAALLATNLADSNYIEPNYIPHISRTAERKLNPDYFTDVSTEFKSSYPDDDFFVRSVDLCSGWGAFITEGAWWLKYWTGLDNGQYLMHPCFLNFFKMKDFTSELRGGDTINIFCEELEDLPNVDPECFNSFCQFPNQVLGLAMRRNGKKRRLEFPNLPYCYMQEIEYEGYENILDSETGIFTRLDTFYVNLTLLVSDSTTPEMLIKPCDTCIIGLTASPLDCDTAWITRSDSIIVNDSIIEYFWEAEDRCMNFNRLAIFKNLLAADQIWYEDLDADGFGNENNSVIWAGQIPGYSLIGGDCDDLNAQRHPGIMEDSLDNFDNDCDGHGNFEECLNSDFLAYASECLPQVYHWNPAQLEFNSNDATCFLLDSRFDGDIWFQTSAPESGSLNIAFVADFEPFKMYLSRGNCNQLEVIDCPDSSVIDVDDLVPSEPLFIQLVNDRGTSTPFSICLTSSENTTSLPEINPNEYFRTYPNPVQNFQNMEWKIEKPTTASLNIYSIFGQRVATIFENEYLSQTVGHTTFNTGRLVGGYYVVMLKTSEKTFIHK
ncbi:MAG: hypothetical protein OEQ53_23060, partial [Saprospiraceae bacterium]|nr:hypothetical protein [Saprospiraceae bacterium]